MRTEAEENVLRLEREIKTYKDRARLTDELADEVRWLRERKTKVPRTQTQTVCNITSTQ